MIYENLKLLSRFTEIFTIHILTRINIIFFENTEHSNRITRQATENMHLNILRYRSHKLQKCIKH